MHGNFSKRTATAVVLLLYYRSPALQGSAIMVWTLVLYCTWRTYFWKSVDLSSLSELHYSQENLHCCCTSVGETSIQIVHSAGQLRHLFRRWLPLSTGLSRDETEVLVGIKSSARLYSVSLVSCCSALRNYPRSGSLERDNGSLELGHRCLRALAQQYGKALVLARGASGKYACVQSSSL